jgi:hypothetical protein
MKTLMRNGRDRRLGKPVMGHAILERALLFGTRSADHIRASGHSGCIAMELGSPFDNRPNTWLHPNASQNVRFLLHRGRRPYMTHKRHKALSKNFTGGGAWSVGSSPGLLFLRCGIEPANHRGVGYIPQSEMRISSRGYQRRYRLRFDWPKNHSPDCWASEAQGTAVSALHRCKHFCR